MIAQLTALLPVWGPSLVGAMAFLSCMMVPVPTSNTCTMAGCWFARKAAIAAVIVSG